MMHLLAVTTPIKFFTQVLNQLLFHPGEAIIIDRYHENSMLIPLNAVEDEVTK
jgi:hypothetical protein